MSNKYLYFMACGDRTQQKEGNMFVKRKYNSIRIY